MNNPALVAERAEGIAEAIWNDLKTGGFTRNCPERVTALKAIAQDVRTLEAAESRCAELERALRRIEKWFGEFPEVTDSRGIKCSYGYAYGSNGERDFMRDIARAALSTLNTGEGNG